MTYINGPFHSTSVAVEDYFKNLGFHVPKDFFEINLGFHMPKDFFEMFHFNFTNFIPTLDKFKIFALRFVDVNNNNVKNFYFGLSFDWRITFNFKIDFSGPDFAKLRNLFRFLTEVFLSLSNPNINFEQFFVEILPEFRNKFGSKELDEDDSNIAQWFQLVVKSFHNLLNQFDSKLFDHGNTANFLDELSKIIEHFSKGTLANVCKLQYFMLKSAGKLEVFGENLEKDMILGIRNVRNEAHDAFMCELNSAIGTFLPLQTIKKHPTDRPWMTKKIKNCICKRQIAFIRQGKDSLSFKF
jgi:hypothetical protein